MARPGRSPRETARLVGRARASGRLLGRLALLLLLARAAFAAPAEPPRPAEHLVLLDASGSMIKAGYSTPEAYAPQVKEWLEKALRPDGAMLRADDTVTFQPFSFEDRQGLHQEGRVGPVPLGELRQALDRVPGAEPDGATNLEYALDLAGPRQPGTPVRFLWLLTDNANNIRGKTTDADFYRRLRDDPAIDSVYFFPLAEASGTGDGGGAEPAGGLVLYLLVDADQPTAPWIEKFVARVRENLGFPGILFRPLYADPDRPVLRVGHRIEVRDRNGRYRAAVRTAEPGNPVEVPMEREGRDLAAHLRFRLESLMDGWEIVDAKLQRPRVEMEGPAGEVQPTLRPLTLNVKPGAESQEEYDLDLKMAPREGALRGTLAVNAVVRLAPSASREADIRPSVPEEVRQRMEAVHGLPEILDYMLHQGGEGDAPEEETRVIAVREALVLVPREAGWGALAWLAGGLLALLAAAAAALALAGRSYQLSGPDGERTVRLGGAFRKVDLETRDGELLGTLRPAGRGLQVRPEPEVKVDGQEEPLRLDLDQGEVRFAMQGPRGPAAAWSVQRGSGAGRSGGNEEGLSL